MILSRLYKPKLRTLLAEGIGRGKKRYVGPISKRECITSGIIAATALHLDMPLVSRDTKIKAPAIENV